MVKRRKDFICRKYEDDLWGNVLLKGKNNRLTNLVQWKVLPRREKKMYREYLHRLRKSRKMPAKIMMWRQKIMCFYGKLNKAQYKKLCKKVVFLRKGRSNKDRDLDKVDYLFVMEQRLNSLVYRMNFVGTMHEGRQCILHGVFMVNERVVRSPNYLVKRGSYISIHPSYRSRMRKKLLNRYSNNKILCNYPKYIEVNYNIMCGFFIGDVTVESVPYPCDVNIDCLAGLAASNMY